MGGIKYNFAGSLAQWLRRWTPVLDVSTDPTVGTLLVYNILLRPSWPMQIDKQRYK